MPACKEGLPGPRRGFWGALRQSVPQNGRVHLHIIDLKTSFSRSEFLEGGPQKGFAEVLRRVLGRCLVVGFNRVEGYRPLGLCPSMMVESVYIYIYIYIYIILFQYLQFILRKPDISRMLRAMMLHLLRNLTLERHQLRIANRGCFGEGVSAIIGELGFFMKSVIAREFLQNLTLRLLLRRRAAEQY